MVTETVMNGNILGILFLTAFSDLSPQSIIRIPDDPTPYGFFYQGVKVADLPTFEDKSYGAFQSKPESANYLLDGQKSVLYTLGATDGERDYAIIDMPWRVMADELVLPIGNISQTPGTEIRLELGEQQNYDVITSVILRPEDANTTLSISIPAAATAPAFPAVAETATFVIDEPTNLFGFKIDLQAGKHAAVQFNAFEWPTNEFLVAVFDHQGYLTDIANHYVIDDVSRMIISPTSGPGTYYVYVSAGDAYGDYTSTDGKWSFYSPVNIPGPMAIEVSKTDYGPPMPDQYTEVFSYYDSVYPDEIYNITAASQTSVAWYRIYLDGNPEIVTMGSDETTGWYPPSLALYSDTGDLIAFDDGGNYTGFNSMLKKVLFGRDSVYLAVSNTSATAADGWVHTPSGVIEEDVSMVFKKAAVSFITPEDTQNTIAAYDSATYVLAESDSKFTNQFRVRIYNFDGSEITIEAVEGSGFRRIGQMYQESSTFYTTEKLTNMGEWVELMYDNMADAFQVVARSQVEKWFGALDVAAPVKNSLVLPNTVSYVSLLSGFQNVILSGGINDGIRFHDGDPVNDRGNLYSTDGIDPNYPTRYEVALTAELRIYSAVEEEALVTEDMTIYIDLVLENYPFIVVPMRLAIPAMGLKVKDTEGDSYPECRITASGIALVSTRADRWMLRVNNPFTNRDLRIDKVSLIIKDVPQTYENANYQPNEW